MTVTIGITWLMLRDKKKSYIDSGLVRFLDSFHHRAFITAIYWDRWPGRVGNDGEAKAEMEWGDLMKYG